MGQQVNCASKLNMLIKKHREIEFEMDAKKLVELDPKPSDLFMIKSNNNVFVGGLNPCMLHNTGTNCE